MDRFLLGDRVVVAYDHAGMVRGEKATVVGFLEEHGMVVIGMWEYDGLYNMLPETLMHIRGSVNTQ